MHNTFKYTNPQRNQGASHQIFHDHIWGIYAPWQRSLSCVLQMCCQLRQRSDFILVQASGRGSGKSGIRPYLGCGCSDVPGKLEPGLSDPPGRSDPPWQGAAQLLQGEFCVAGV